MRTKQDNKRGVYLLGLIVLCLALLPATGQGDVFASGDLTTADGGLLANGVWSTNGASVWYQVSNIDADSWFYEYEVTISGSEGDLSHIILETSQNADIRKLIGDSSFKLVGPTTFGDEGNSNPGIPGEIYGIKLDELTEMTFAFSFESYNGPMWGNIYAKDGAAGGADNYLYNAGFGTPLSDVQRYDFSNEYLDGRYILVPDTYVIPAPAAVLLGVLGLGTAGVRLRRRT